MRVAALRPRRFLGSSLRPGSAGSSGPLPPKAREAGTKLALVSATSAIPAKTPRRKTNSIRTEQTKYWEIMCWGCWSGQKFGFGVRVAGLRHASVPLASAQPLETGLGKRYVTDFCPEIEYWDGFLLVNVYVGLHFIINNFRSIFSSFLYDASRKRSVVRGESRGVRRWAGCGVPAEGSRAPAGVPHILPAQRGTASVRNKSPNAGLKEVLLRFWRKQLQFMNITQIHRLPLLPNFEGNLIIWSLESKYFWRTKLD